MTAAPVQLRPCGATGAGGIWLHSTPTTKPEPYPDNYLKIVGTRSKQGADCRRSPATSVLPKRLEEPCRPGPLPWRAPLELEPA